MLLETMSKAELIDILKPYLLKCTKDINLGEIQFLKGHCYLYTQNEGGNWVEDDNGNCIDLCELEDEYKIKDGFKKIE